VILFFSLAYVPLISWQETVGDVIVYPLILINYHRLKIVDPDTCVERNAYPSNVPHAWTIGKDYFRVE